MLISLCLDPRAADTLNHPFITSIAIQLPGGPWKTAGVTCSRGVEGTKTVQGPALGYTAPPHKAQMEAALNVLNSNPFVGTAAWRERWAQERERG